MHFPLRLDITHVQELVSSINALGFIDTEAKGLAVELYGPEGDDIRSFNNRLIESSGGRLGQCGYIRFASLEGSHGNFAARAVLSQAVHQDPRVTDGEKICLSKIDQKWLAALRQGLCWTVLRHEVLSTFPEMAQLLQMSGNALQAQAKVESELQLAQKSLKEIMKHPSGCTFQQVEEEIMRSRPLHKEAVPFIFTFCLRFSGGSDSDSFTTTESYIRTLGGGLKSLGAPLWDALTQDHKALAPTWRHMLLRTAFGIGLSVSDVAWFQRVVVKFRAGFKDLAGLYSPPAGHVMVLDLAGS